jgi:hypothetical protein
MKDKIIEILKENIEIYSEECKDDLADGLLIESVCKDSAKEIEALFGSEMKEQNQVIEILKGHVDDLQEQIAKRDELIRLQDMSYCNLIDWFENGSVYDHNKERLAMDEQINELKAEIE